MTPLPTQIGCEIAEALCMKSELVTLSTGGLNKTRAWIELEDSDSLDDMYHIGAQIGEGGFGKVFQCTEAHADGESSPLCMKVVPLNGRHISRVAKCPLEERQILLDALLSMHHPNVVKYCEFVFTSDSFNIIMSRCLGPSLSSFLSMNNDSLEVPVVRTCAEQMLSALASVHAAGIMHRDIKTDNFQFQDASATRLQLLDFGFVKHAPRRPMQHTVTGSLIYVGPEVLDGVYHHSCDLWGVGVVLFQIFSGQVPFDSSDVNILRSLHKDPVLTGSSLFRGILWKRMPGAGKDLIRGLLTVDPEARLSAVAALEHAWFQDGQADGAEEAKLGSYRSLTHLRRNELAWNLVDIGSDSSSELDDENEQPCVM